MNLDDCEIREFRTEHQKYGVRITHRPTGVQIEGNCGWVDKVQEVKDTLLKLLEESVKDAPILPPVPVPETREKIEQDTRIKVLDQCAKIVEKYMDREDGIRAAVKAIRALK